MLITSRIGSYTLSRVAQSVLWVTQGYDAVAYAYGRRYAVQTEIVVGIFFGLVVRIAEQVDGISFGCPVYVVVRVR